MMKHRFSSIVLVTTALALTGCFNEESVPPPSAATLTDDVSSYFCGMNVASHDGPKAQVFLAGEDDPIWFSAVRDMFGFLMLPGESRDITAIWVSNMSEIVDWSQTGQGPWIDPKDAWFVLDSRRPGGMGAIELVPFASEETAKRYKAEFGGRIARFADIGEQDIFNMNEEAALDDPADTLTENEEKS